MRIHMLLLACCLLVLTVAVAVTATVTVTNSSLLTGNTNSTFWINGIAAKDDNSTVYAVINYQPGSYYYGDVVTSTDGGLTFPTVLYTVAPVSSAGTMKGICTSSDGSDIFVYDEGQYLLLYSNDSGTTFGNVSVSADPIFTSGAPLFHCDDQGNMYVVAQTNDIEMFDTNGTGSTVYTDGTFSGVFYDVATSDDGQYIVASKIGPSTWIYSDDGGSSFSEIGSHSEDMGRVDISADGSKMIVATYDASYVYISTDGSTDSSTDMYALLGTSNAQSFGVGISADGTRYAVVISDSTNARTYVLVSSDDGATWEVAVNESDSVWSMGFYSPYNAYFGNDNFYVSSDAFNPTPPVLKTIYISAPVVLPNLSANVTPDDRVIIGQTVYGMYNLTNAVDDVLQRWLVDGITQTTIGKQQTQSDSSYTTSVDECAGLRFKTLANQTSVYDIAVKGRSNAGSSVTAYFRSSSCGTPGFANEAQCSSGALVSADAGWIGAIDGEYSAIFDVAVNQSTYYYVYYCDAFSKHAVIRRKLSNVDSDVEMMLGTFADTSVDPYFVSTAVYSANNYTPVSQGVNVTYLVSSVNANLSANASVLVNTPAEAQNISLTSNPIAYTNITATYDYFDAEGDAFVSAYYQWYDDGSLIVGQNGLVLPGNQWTPGANVTFEVTLYDGWENSTPVNASVQSDVTPIISNVDCGGSTYYPNELDMPSIASILVQFDILDPLEFANFTLDANVTPLSESSCVYSALDAQNRAYNCTFQLHYYDGYGAYTVDISSNNGFASDMDSSETCTAGQLIASQRITDAVGFSDAAPGITNVKADDPIVVKNTGNVDLHMYLTAYDLIGRQYPADTLAADTFKAGQTLGTSVQLDDGVQKNLSLVFETGNGAQEDLWLWLSMSQNQRIQDYYSVTSWQLVGLAS